jgi:lipoprotein-anchoring transpeptidase ErfK/SrfK
MPRRSAGIAPLVLALLCSALIAGTTPALAGARRAPDGVARSRERFLSVVERTRGATPRERRPEHRDAALAIPDLGTGESLLAHLGRSIPITSRPGAGRTIATMPATSPYYRAPIVAWVQRVSPDERFGFVSVPFAAGTPAGWIALRRVELSTTDVAVEADRSSHELVVRRHGDVILRAPAATGAPSSPTPTGSYFVTDRVAFPRGGALGTFAFGISGIQTDLPAGWDGGDQLAIHGTDDPGSIGTSASAGCLRVSERVLDRLRPLLQPGTPVVIVP